MRDTHRKDLAAPAAMQIIRRIPGARARAMRIARRMRVTVGMEITVTLSATLGTGRPVRITRPMAAGLILRRRTTETAGTPRLARTVRRRGLIQPLIIRRHQRRTIRLRRLRTTRPHTTPHRIVLAAVAVPLTPAVGVEGVRMVEAVGAVMAVEAAAITNSKF
jgi:hypothetical protein